MIETLEVIGSGFIAGKPIPKGSLKPRITRRANGQMSVTLHDKPEADAWKLTMIRAIMDNCGIVALRGPDRKVIGYEPAPYPGPVAVRAVFYFAQRIGADGLVWPSHDTPWPMADDIGDTDKLQRNLGDALEQSGLIANDRNIVRWLDPEKQWADGGKPGVYWAVGRR